MFRLICLDMIKGGFSDSRSMQTPRIPFSLAADCVTRFVRIDDLEFKRIFNRIEFADIFEFLESVE